MTQSPNNYLDGMSIIIGNVHEAMKVLHMVSKFQYKKPLIIRYRQAKFLGQNGEKPTSTSDFRKKYRIHGAENDTWITIESPVFKKIKVLELNAEFDSPYSK